MMSTFWILIAWTRLLVSTVTAAGCYDNEALCVTEMQKILTDTSTFWFGSSYLQACPASAQGATICRNPDREGKSVMGRLLNMSDATGNDILTTASQAISFLHVTFTAPAGDYYACGHNFTVPAVTSHRIDPLQTTRVSSLSLSQIPSFSWKTTDPRTYYTLIVWDAGNFYLHGLYVNCQNGSVASGKDIRVYHGPRNPFLREDVYIFVVYEQTNRMNVNTAVKMLNLAMGQSTAGFHPDYFISLMGTELQSSPVFANLMRVVADPYSIQWQKDSFRVNNCPFLISQLPAFQTLIKVTEVPVKWSDPTSSSSLDMITPYLTTLNVAIGVEYSTEDFTVESCCVNYSLSRGKFIPNPFSNRTERPSMLRLTPRVHFSPMDIKSGERIAENVYTLFTLDVAAALEAGVVANTTFITHWMVTNIRNADLRTGDELAAYFGPNPMTPKQGRPYMFLLVKQPNNILVDNTILTQFCPTGGQRCRLHWKSLMDAWNFKEIVGLNWFWAEQDFFAIWRMYEVIKNRSKADACKGLPGYADPCPPATCPSQAPDLSARGTNIVITVLIILVCTHFKIL